jgi:hypothetical protein
MAAEGAKLPGSVYFAGVDEPQAGGTATARPKGGTEAEGAERTRGHGERLAKTGSSHTSFKTTRTQLRLSREVSPAGTGGTIASRSWLLSCYYTDESEVITTATHGQLSFKDGRGVLNPAAGSLEEARQARFMRVEVDPRKFADLTPPEQVERVTLFRGLVGFMQEAWQMDMPSVIFSVTGSAQEFTLRPKFRDTFMSALLNATRSTNAWIVTGGSDSGIMKLVGDTLARGKQMETAVGIASWSAVHGRTELSPSESKAQKELKRSMPACTIRVETTDARAYTEEKLNEVLSRYGPVIGVSLAKSSSGTSLKRLLQKAMKSHSNLGDPANSASNWPEKTAFVTFRDPTSAENAARRQVLRFRISNSDPHQQVFTAGFSKTREAGRLMIVRCIWNTKQKCLGSGVDLGCRSCTTVNVVRTNKFWGHDSTPTTVITCWSILVFKDFLRKSYSGRSCLTSYRFGMMPRRPQRSRS